MVDPAALRPRRPALAPPERQARRDRAATSSFTGCRPSAAADDNAALAYAVERANELGVPCLVYEALRPGLPARERSPPPLRPRGRARHGARASRSGASRTCSSCRARRTRRAASSRSSPRGRASSCPTTSRASSSPRTTRRRPRGRPAPSSSSTTAPWCRWRSSPSRRSARARSARRSRARSTPGFAPSPSRRPPSALPGRIDLPFDPVDLANADDRASTRSSRRAPSTTRSRPSTRPPAARARPSGAWRAFVRGPPRDVRRRPQRPVARRRPAASRPTCTSGWSAPGVSPSRRATGVGGPGLDAFLEQLLVRRALSFNFARSRADHAKWTRAARLGPGDARGARGRPALRRAVAGRPRGGALPRRAVERGDERAPRRAASSSRTRACSGASCRSCGCGARASARGHGAPERQVGARRARPQRIRERLLVLRPARSAVAGASRSSARCAR